MAGSEVRVPGALLLDRQLRDTSKLLWMVRMLWDRRHTMVSTGSLAVRSGLAPHTVRRGLAELSAFGWLPAAASWDRQSSEAHKGDWAKVPEDLIVDARVGVSAKLLYGAIQLTEGFHGAKGQFTFAQMADLTGMSRNTVKMAIRSLHATGWLVVEQKNKLKPVSFTLCNPVAARRQTEVDEAKWRLIEAAHKCERLMREYLDLLVARTDYEDNARPTFLVNPMTGQKMEFDRYYPPGVAFEYNGPQHYRTTARFPKEEQVREQQARDLMKTAICLRVGINLVLVHNEDLSLKAMLAKVKGLLPLQSLEGREELIKYLDARGRYYRRKSQQEEKQKAATGQ